MIVKEGDVPEVPEVPAPGLDCRLLHHQKFLKVNRVSRYRVPVERIT